MRDEVVAFATTDRCRSAGPGMAIWSMDQDPVTMISVRCRQCDFSGEGVLTPGFHDLMALHSRSHLTARGFDEIRWTIMPLPFESPTGSTGGR